MQEKNRLDQPKHVYSKFADYFQVHYSGSWESNYKISLWKNNTVEGF